MVLPISSVESDDAHDLIVSEGFTDEGGDQSRLEGLFNGQVILVEVTGYDDNGEVGVGFLELPGQIETIDVRQFGVQKGHAEGLSFSQGYGFLGVKGLHTGKTIFSEDIFENPAHLGLIINNEKRGVFLVHGSPPP